MARARFIRPEFFADEKIGELSFGARLLFAGIWCHSDLRGVFDWSPKLLRVQIFPFDEGVTSAQVSEWLTKLSDCGMVASFEAETKSWGVVTAWSRYQEATTREVEIGSRRPLPPGWVDPVAWAEIIEKARKAGRIAQASPWNNSRTVPERFQNPTATATATATTTATTAAPQDARLAAVAAEGGYLDLRGQDMRPQWIADLAGDTPERIREVMHWGRKRTGKPVRMPSAYCEHRAFLDSAARERSCRLRAQDEANQRARLAKESADRERALLSALLALADDFGLNEPQEAILASLRTARDTGKPFGLMLVRYLDLLPTAMVAQAKMQASEHTKEGASP